MRLDSMLTWALRLVQHLESEELKQQLFDLDHLTEQGVDSLRTQYLDKVQTGDNDWTAGFGSHYKMAKALLIGYARTLAESLSRRPSSSRVYVNTMTPGLTGTDILPNHIPMARTVEHGADTIVWLALFPSGGPNGLFLRDRADHPF